MSPRTVCPAPTDGRMWRRLLARTHPDHGGEHDLFIWTRALQEHVAADAISPPPREAPRRNPSGACDVDQLDYPSSGANLAALSRRALELDVEEPYRTLLRLLGDCKPAASSPLVREQGRGASYKRLAAIGHLVGLNKAERARWYRICESIPLSDRHAGHILNRLNGRTKAA